VGWKQSYDGRKRVAHRILMAEICRKMSTWETEKQTNGGCSWYMILHNDGLYF
jgi:hypothetical protein